MAGGEAEWLSLAFSGGYLFFGVLNIVAARAWWKSDVARAIAVTAVSYFGETVLGRAELMHMGVLQTFWTWPFV